MRGFRAGSSYERLPQGIRTGDWQSGAQRVACQKTTQREIVREHTLSRGQLVVRRVIRRLHAICKDRVTDPSSVKVRIATKA